MMKLVKLLLFSLLISLWLVLPGWAQDKWEKEISAFEQQDQAIPPVKNGILFTGSSSIRGWKSLAEDFPGKPVLNRGFGGSEIEDITQNFDRLITPYTPRQIVIYSGDNDINSGKSPEQVARDFQELFARIRAELPKTHVVFISIKPSPARWEKREEMAQANLLIQQFLESKKRTAFVDIWPLMLGPGGQPIRSLYLGDGLHMTPAGYAVWAEAVRPHLRKR
jgi:lysophospholipase L1-like esterase